MDPLNQHTPDEFGASPIEIDGYKGHIIWKYNPQVMVYEGESIAPHWTCGWKVTVNGKQYGCWITVAEPTEKLTDELRGKAETVMLEHARESIKAVLARSTGAVATKA